MKRRVGGAVLPRRRIDAGDPQRAELPLALFAVAVGVLQGLLDLDLGGPVQAGFAAPVALGELENLLAAVLAIGSIF